DGNTGGVDGLHRPKRCRRARHAVNRAAAVAPGAASTPCSPTIVLPDHDLLPRHRTGASVARNDLACAPGERRRMPYKISQWDRQWIDEMRQNPLGPHSPNLQRVLNTLRAGPAKGRYVLVTRKPFAEWVLAVHQGYGKPFRI